jgi:hypothetical protein
MRTAKLYSDVNESGLNQESNLTSSTWEGAAIVEYRGAVADLYPLIPVFSRHPFRAGGDENRYKDEIRREPLQISESPIPIATVGKTYSLVQHRDVVASVFRALNMIGIDISALESTLILSEYGERMQWSCNIPNFDFDPGDKCPIVLQINCLNSVDTSTVLEVTFAWYRLVCSNGMMFGVRDSWLRRRHIQSLDPNDVAAHLREQLEQIPTEESLYKEWLAQSVRLEELQVWIDEVVAQSWGPHAAARIWNILKDGFDGDVQPAKNRKPHELEVAATREVPGAYAPVDNLFHVSQALSWLAGTRQTVQERLERVEAIPALMKPLSTRSKRAAASS